MDSCQFTEDCKGRPLTGSAVRSPRLLCGASSLKAICSCSILLLRYISSERARRTKSSDGGIKKDEMGWKGCSDHKLLSSVNAILQRKCRAVQGLPLIPVSPRHIPGRRMTMRRCCKYAELDNAGSAGRLPLVSAVERGAKDAPLTWTASRWNMLDPPLEMPGMEDKGALTHGMSGGGTWNARGG